MNKCYSQAAYGKFIEDSTAATVKAQGGNYGGGSENLVINYQNTIGSLCASDVKGVGNQYVQEGKVIVETDDKKNENYIMATQQGGAENRTDNIAPTLTAAAGMSGNNQPVYCAPATHGLDGYNSALTGDKSATLGVNCGMSTGRNGVCAFQGQAASGAGISASETTVPTIQSSKQADISDGYIVRRLTPLECERLQGFPDNWTVVNPIADMSEAEYTFWKTLLFEKAIREGKARQDTNGEFNIWREVASENEEGEIEKVWENTHRPYKHKTKAQMIKWYNKTFTENTDSQRYKALGNSIALPPWYYILSKLSLACGADTTMASLFDGIGGFPLLWEDLNGKGKCLWASEIEEFPIAVTKYHFNGG